MYIFCFILLTYFQVTYSFTWCKNRQITFFNYQQVVPTLTICYAYYQNGKEELDKLLKFLDIDLDEKLKCDIIEMCSFEKMQKDKGSDKMSEAFLKRDFKFYRKGITPYPAEFPKYTCPSSISGDVCYQF